MMDSLDSDPDVLCGFGAWRPTWIQKFANSKGYLFVHCILNLFQVSKESVP